MSHEAQQHEDRCKHCGSEYRCVAYTMGSGDIMAVKECDCSSPSTHDVTAQDPKMESRC